MLTVLLTILHVAVSFVLILVVLLQRGKRADLAGAFGGGGSQTAFGTRGAATFLSKATTGSAVLFMITSLGLSIIATRGATGGGTVLPDDRPAASQPAQAPVDDPLALPPFDSTAPADSDDSGDAQDPAQP